MLSFLIKVWLGCIIAKAWTDLPCKTILKKTVYLICCYINSIASVTGYVTTTHVAVLDMGFFFSSEQVMWSLFPFRTDFLF